MSQLPVRFTYVTGTADPMYKNFRLKGSWDVAGRYSDNWCRAEMTEIPGTDGCPTFSKEVNFDTQQIGWSFHWGVECEGPNGEVAWAIMTEQNDMTSAKRFRTFALAALSENGTVQHEIYWLNHSRRIGAQKYRRENGTCAIQFSVWAPNAKAVDVCIGTLWRDDDLARKSLIDLSIGVLGARGTLSAPRYQICGGYISNNGDGSLPGWRPYRLTEQSNGLWVSDPNAVAFADFAKFDHIPYMYRITKDDGSVAYRTDLYSRCQIGFGGFRPSAKPYEGHTHELDGTVSCSVVVDPDLVTTEFLEPNWPEKNWTPQGEFFAKPPPDPGVGRLQTQDLVIYEMHVGALGAATRPKDEPGTLGDAIALLDYLVDLGVNAVELLPMSEFGGGGGGWGYATSHYFAIEYAGGGRDQYKWFIRECHKRGIAVLLDVVYNHYNHSAERAEWMYDTNSDERNIYYWYEGQASDYSDFPQGGYVDNVSTAWAPRYWDEMVRNMFVSSAIALALEFKVDGFRVDQTTSIHSYNALHLNGRRLDNVNAFGAKFLRELTRSLKFVKPQAMLIAEDHSNWDGVTRSPDEGGLGFDATWYADFYHHLIGDTDKGSDYAKLIKTAGLGDDRPLAMDYFAGALQASGGGKVVYNESHDEAGNGHLTDRTINVAVNGAPLFGETRRYAEARCRFAAGVTILSAGTPMFLFGEEVGFEKKFLYGEVLQNREDLQAMRSGSGRLLFEYYGQLIRLRKDHPGFRSHDIDVLFVHNEHRLIAFRRWGNGEDFVVVASLNNRPYNQPNYTFRADRFPSGEWREIFNSDAAQFGGDNIGNAGQVHSVREGQLAAVVPANGLIVFQRV